MTKDFVVIYNYVISESINYYKFQIQAACNGRLVQEKSWYDVFQSETDDFFSFTGHIKSVIQPFVDRNNISGHNVSYFSFYSFKA